MNSGVNIIFYSKQCPTCFKLMHCLQTEDFLKYFRVLCVDGKADMLPPQITSVPMMIVTNVNRPLAPEECFKWVKCMVDFRDNKKDKDNKDNDHVQGYADMELGKFSDQFTMIKGEEALSQAFCKYGKENENVIHTAPREGKISGREQTKKIKELEISRSQQDNKFKVDMKMEQRAILSKTNKKK